MSCPLSVAAMGSPVVIGSPLAGDDWVALNGCCGVTSHRGAVMGVGGRLNGSERYTIDWVRLDPTKDPATTFTGDGKRNEDYLAFDAQLLAVADGTVTTVVSNLNEAVPQVITADGRSNIRDGALLWCRLNRYEAEHARLGIVRREPDHQDVGGKLAGQVIQGPGQERSGLGIAVPIGIGRVDVEVAYAADRVVPPLNGVRRCASESRRLQVGISLSRNRNRRPATDWRPGDRPIDGIGRH
jgi:hypothetical protein